MLKIIMCLISDPFNEFYLFIITEIYVMPFCSVIKSSNIINLLMYVVKFRVTYLYID